MLEPQYSFLSSADENEYIIGNPPEYLDKTFVYTMNLINYLTVIRLSGSLTKLEEI